MVIGAGAEEMDLAMITQLGFPTALCVFMLMWYKQDMAEQKKTLEAYRAEDKAEKADLKQSLAESNKMNTDMRETLAESQKINLSLSNCLAESQKINLALTNGIDARLDGISGDLKTIILNQKVVA